MQFTYIHAVKTITHKIKIGAGEMAQHLKALGALAENMGLTPSTHMMSHIQLQFQF